MNILGSQLSFHCKTMIVKHNKQDLFEQQTVNMCISHSKSLKKENIFVSQWATYATSLLTCGKPKTFESVVIATKQKRGIRKRHTMRLSCSPSIERNELSGRFYFLGYSTGVPWTWGLEGEVFRCFHCPIARSCPANSDLKWCHCIDWILHPWAKNSSFATISNLHAVRRTRKQVNCCWVSPAAVWYIAFKFRAIPLLYGLCTDHAPDDLLLCPSPPKMPPRCLDMTILLVIVYGNNSLWNADCTEHQQQKNTWWRL